MSIEHFGEYIQNINGTLERIRMVDSSDYAGDVNVQVMSMIPFKENVDMSIEHFRENAENINGTLQGI